MTVIIHAYFYLNVCICNVGNEDNCRLLFQKDNFQSNYTDVANKYIVDLCIHYKEFKFINHLVSSGREVSDHRLNSFLEFIHSTIRIG